MTFLNIVIKLFTRILLLQKGYIFCSLFNLRSFILNLKTSATYKDKKYIFRDKTFPNVVRYSNHKFQSYLSYYKGFSGRVKELGECYFLEKIEFKKDDIVIDCGANIGDLKLWFDQTGIEIKYIGFEPSPIEYENLIKNTYPSQVYNIGLWNEDSEINFYISSKYADSSFIKPKKYEQVIKVLSKKLEYFIDKRIKLLKLEAEGGEPEILLGAMEKLKFIEYISADLGFERGVKEESTIVPVTNYLLNNGFELVDINNRRLCALFKNKELN